VYEKGEDCAAAKQLAHGLLKLGNEASWQAFYVCRHNNIQRAAANKAHACGRWEDTQPMFHWLRLLDKYSAVHPATSHYSGRYI
jgi:membrane glycosyltransferase